jgi:hypothetical protein
VKVKVFLKMVRQAICEPKFETYLAGLGQSSKLSIGLIIGQVQEFAFNSSSDFNFGCF